MMLITLFYFLAGFLLLVILAGLAIITVNIAVFMAKVMWCNPSKKEGGKL